MAENDDDKLEPIIEPWQDEDNWQQIAVALAVVGVILLPFVAWWALDATDDAARLTRVQIAAPFGILYVAAITFVTAIWRGLIIRRQADNQQQQIAYISHQIASTDENNLALLLQKGAELIANAEEKAHVSAGIAILRAVATAKNGRFAVEALDLLAGYITAHSTEGHEDVQLQAAIEALNGSYSETGRKASRTIDCRADGDSQAIWTPIFGAAGVRYWGGAIIGPNFPHEFRSSDYFFFDVFFTGLIEATITNCIIDNCHFVTCSFKEIEYIATCHCRYERCDFTGTKIHLSVIRDKAPDIVDYEYTRAEDEIQALKGLAKALKGNHAIPSISPTVVVDNLNVTDLVDWKNILVPSGMLPL